MTSPVSIPAPRESILQHPRLVVEQELVLLTLRASIETDSRLIDRPIHQQPILLSRDQLRERRFPECQRRRNYSRARSVSCSAFLIVLVSLSV